MADKMLKIKGLKLEREGTPTLNGLDLELPAGQLHVLMGPNGSGKSSLAYALMGHPSCQVKSGRLSLDGRSLLKMTADERSRAGLFLAPQSSPELPGVGVSSVLRAAVNSHLDRPLDAIAFRDRLLDALEEVGLNQDFANRDLNQGFSGGERKRTELLQLILLQPKYAVLDEIDSGLDVDGLQTVAKAIEAVRKQGAGVLLITHYDRLLKLLKPNKVHVLIDGKLVKTGGPKLADRIIDMGFRKFVAAAQD